MVRTRAPGSGGASPYRASPYRASPYRYGEASVHDRARLLCPSRGHSEEGWPIRWIWCAL
jgi:hypothetical protein